MHTHTIRIHKPYLTILCFYFVKYIHCSLYDLYVCVYMHIPTTDLQTIHRKTKQSFIFIMSKINTYSGLYGLYICANINNHDSLCRKTDLRQTTTVTRSVAVILQLFVIDPHVRTQREPILLCEWNFFWMHILLWFSICQKKLHTYYGLYGLYICVQKQNKLWPWP